MRLPCFKNGAGIVPAKYDTSLHSRSQINSTTYPDKLEEGAVTTHQAVEVNDADTSDAKSVERLSGWRLYGTAFVCQLCIFLANLEVSIVSTALIDITDHLKSFDRSSWVISSYLLTYTGFLLIWAKLSDSLGRRQCLCACILIFTVASGACGGAQTATQLIIFRAFQGVGGSGLLSINFVILPEMVEAKRYPLYATFTSCAFVLGFLFGPIFGGAIVDSTTWRWVFWINLPLGVCALILLFLFLPVGFPNLEATKAQIELSKLFEIDAFGALLVFGACAFIVSALEESGAAYSWDSATIIVLVVLSGASALIFPFWEFAIHRRWKTIQAIFPWRLLTHRVFMGAFMACFLAGVNVTVSVIQIPQEWQTVFGTSALEAGIRLLPFTLSYAAGTILSMILATKLKVPPVFVVLSGGILQSVATCVIALLPVRGGAGKYVCECISGVGAGQNIGVLVQLIPQLITGPDQAVAMGAITQSRALGGVIGFAITWNVFNAYIRHGLSGVLESAQLEELLQSLAQTSAELSPDRQQIVADTFARAYDLENTILIGFAVAQIAVVALLWEKDFRRLS